MHNRFDDIRSRIKEEPSWYDSNGTPRYGLFHPDFCPNIYAAEVVLFEISCQDCDERFFVENNFSLMELVFNKNAKPISERIKLLHYGDPPTHNCVGDTMNCNDIRVVEFWHHPDFEWIRRPELETQIDEEIESEIKHGK